MMCTRAHRTLGRNHSSPLQVPLNTVISSRPRSVNFALPSELKTRVLSPAREPQLASEHAQYTSITGRPLELGAPPQPADHHTPPTMGMSHALRRDARFMHAPSASPAWDAPCRRAPFACGPCSVSPHSGPFVRVVVAMVGPEGSGRRLQWPPPTRPTGLRPGPPRPGGVGQAAAGSARPSLSRTRRKRVIWCEREHCSLSSRVTATSRAVWSLFRKQ